MKKICVIVIVLILIIFGIYYIIDKIQRERCYNMPINRYVEEKSCEKYTFEQYFEN